MILININNFLYSLILIIYIILTFNGQTSSVYAGSYDDVRCKCLCPLTGVVTNGTNPSNRKMYIGNVPPNQCNCDFVVLPSLDDNVQAKAKEFCPRCECKYESRNTATIRFFVIFIIGMISFLVIYMAFLIILEPWMHRRSIFTSYKHFNEEVSMQEQHSTDDAQLTGTRRRAPTSSSLSQDEGENDDQVPKGMFNRVGHSQSRWKQKVNQQRKNIYDDHTMLN